MKDILVIAAVFATWIALNVWILPWFGIQTCMNGACYRIPSDQPAAGAKPAEREPASRLEDEGNHSRNKPAGMPES
jgi:hypothetical protein